MSQDDSPNRLPVPLTMDVVDRLDPVVEVLRTPRGVKVSVRQGVFTRDSAPRMVKLLNEVETLVVSTAFGIYLPIHVIRRDPVAAVGNLATHMVTRSFIPPRIRA